MTPEQGILALLGLACSVLGWFARELYSAVNDLKDDVKDLEVLLVRDYVSYPRLETLLRPMSDTLADIKRALDHKVEKP